MIGTCALDLGLRALVFTCYVHSRLQTAIDAYGSQYSIVENGPTRGGVRVQGRGVGGEAKPPFCYILVRSFVNAQSTFFDFLGWFVSDMIN